MDSKLLALQFGTSPEPIIEDQVVGLPQMPQVPIFMHSVKPKDFLFSQDLLNMMKLRVEALTTQLGISSLLLILEIHLSKCSTCIYISWEPLWSQRK